MGDFHYLCELIRGTQAFLFFNKTAKFSSWLGRVNYFLSEGAWDAIALSFSNNVVHCRLFPVLCDQKDFFFLSTE